VRHHSRRFERKPICFTASLHNGFSPHLGSPKKFGNFAARHGGRRPVVAQQGGRHAEGAWDPARCKPGLKPLTITDSHAIRMQYF
jgi:hypothetical protein